MAEVTASNAADRGLENEDQTGSPTSLRNRSIEDLHRAFQQQQILGLATVVSRAMEIQAYADRLVIRQDGAIVGEHGEPTVHLPC